MALVLATMTAARSSHAQTDYYNTDAGRPLATEDALPVERRAFELQLAPLRIERRAGQYQWQLEPEIAYGILPRTHVEIGFPLTYIERNGLPHLRGLSGVELSAFYNFNTETRIPALALAGEVLAPLGPLAPDQPLFSVTAIATRTFPAVRVHLNARYTIGVDSAGESHGDEITRWQTGIAVDRVLPLHSMLFTAEVVVRQPVHDDQSLYWQGGAGVRYQVSPRIASDLGIGYRAVPGANSWHVTFGTAIAVGLPWRP